MKQGVWEGWLVLRAQVAAAMVVDSDFFFGVPTARSKSNARVFQKCLTHRQWHLNSDFQRPVLRE